MPATPTGNHLVSNAMPAGKAIPFRDGLRPEVETKSRLELVGTIECPGQDLKSISWSADGKHLATVTNDNVSVWRLPGKSRVKIQRYTNNIDTLSNSQGPSAAQVPCCALSTEDM